MSECPQVMCSVIIPAHLSHTGRRRQDEKPIDACMANVVEALNCAGLETWGSCCGHGDGPSVVIVGSANPDDSYASREIEFELQVPCPYRAIAEYRRGLVQADAPRGRLDDVLDRLGIPSEGSL